MKCVALIKNLGETIPTMAGSHLLGFAESSQSYQICFLMSKSFACINPSAIASLISCCLNCSRRSLNSRFWVMV